jgi:hypothetical protein
MGRGLESFGRQSMSHMDRGTGKSEVMESANRVLASPAMPRRGVRGRQEKNKTPTQDLLGARSAHLQHLRLHFHIEKPLGKRLPRSLITAITAHYSSGYLTAVKRPENKLGNCTLVAGARWQQEPGRQRKAQETARIRLSRSNLEGVQAARTRDWRGLTLLRAVVPCLLLIPSHHTLSRTQGRIDPGRGLQ